MATCPSHSLSLCARVAAAEDRRELEPQHSESHQQVQRNAWCCGGELGIPAFPCRRLGWLPAFLRLRWGRKALRLTATQYLLLLLLPTKVPKMKGRLPLTSIKIKSKVFRFKHLLHTWAQQFRWSKQLSEQPKSSLLISGPLLRHYEFTRKRNRQCCLVVLRTH